jgi:hypothetical protein
VRDDRVSLLRAVPAVELDVAAALQ